MMDAGFEGRPEDAHMSDFETEQLHSPKTHLEDPDPLPTPSPEPGCEP
jgi:hypothetical protein